MNNDICKECNKAQAVQWVLEDGERKKICQECLDEFLDRNGNNE